MELKIISPQEGGFVQEIKWNNEELKREIAAKMQEYKTMVYTEDTIKEAKADRAALNKLVKAIEDERKRIKKLCMSPVDQFEAQVKEIVALIRDPVQLIDSQIKEVEEQKRLQRRKDIEELFRTIGFQVFVTLDMIFDEKWLNASVTLTKIEEQMRSRMYQIGDDVKVIHDLPEFSFEAMEIYKKTLNLNMAIHEGQRLAELQKRKAAYEEEKRRQEAEQKRVEGQRRAMEAKEEVPPIVPQETVRKEEALSLGEKLYTVEFAVKTTRDKLNLLKEFLCLNNITYVPVERKGE